jgi:ATP-binding cassette subfamily F protein 3
MSLLNTHGLAFGFPATDELFREACLQINPQDKIGLVGRNGAGKTSLMRVLAGELAATEGAIVRRSGLRVELVRQPAGDMEHTALLDFVFAAQAELAGMRQRLTQLESRLECPEEYAELVNEYQSRGGYQAEAEARRVLAGLGFQEQEIGLELGCLSSGQRERAALARGLLSGADLILLDEPTNHLDIEGRQWLEDYLSGITAACVVVSHDRAFLNRFTRRILEIERGRIRQFEGNYDEYRQQRALEERQAWESYQAQQRRMAAAERAAERRSQLARHVAEAPAGIRSGRDHYRRKAGKLARTARLLRERATRAPEAVKPFEETPIAALDFSTVRRSGDVALRVEGLSRSCGAKRLFSELSFYLARGERVALDGPNGSGKTTLLRILLGLEHADSGRVQFGANVQIGYYAQEGENLDPARTPLEICGGHTQARMLLACLKLARERVTEPIASLSAGERSKVALVRLLVSGANLLLLDEPTNHLEIEAQEALEQTLAQFPGTVLVVSHDRRFLGGVASRTIRW